MERQPFNILICAQAGRTAYEAALFAASLRHFDPGFRGRVILAEPQPGEHWTDDPRIANDGLEALYQRLGVEVTPLDNRHFGHEWPQGNKIEALALLPPGEPFIFFDSDTLITGPLSQIPLSFDRPGASQRVEGTWPKPTLYGPRRDEIWRTLYDRFGMDYASSVDVGPPEGHWRRNLYFNAGWFCGADPRAFGSRLLEIALAIRDDPGPELAGQRLFPWLDQIALPLVIHEFGGGRDTQPAGYLDGSHSCHYRNLSLLYAREGDHVVEALAEVAKPNWLKKVLKEHEPFRRMHYQARGAKARALFDRSALPAHEAAIRQRLKRQGLWMR